MFSFEGFQRVDRTLRAGFRLIALNLLWCLTIVVGLGVFGFGLANYALARYLDGWCRLGQTPPVVRSYLKFLTERVGQSMLVGALLIAGVMVTTTNILTASMVAIQGLNAFTLAVIVMVGAYVFPLMAASDITSVPGLLRGALFIGWGALPWTLLGGAFVVALTLAIWSLGPAIALLLGAAIPATTIGLITRVVFGPLTVTAPSTAVSATANRRLIDEPAH